MAHFEHGYALLIGVGSLDKYAPWSLPATVGDAQTISATLTDPGLCAYINDRQHIRTLTDSAATRQAIMEDMAWLAQMAQTDPDATIVIYYSGHGWIDTSTNQYYLIQNDVNPLRLAQSALPAMEFTQAVRAIRSRKLLVLIDSCHAQGMATAKSTARAGDTATQQPVFEKNLLPDNFAAIAPPVALTDALKQGEGRAVFTSSRGSQQSWMRPDNAMSIFTYHLREALQGAGNLPSAREVRLSNIQNYLGQHVPKSARDLCGAEQTPFFDMVAEDFPVALARGGKGLPATGWTPDLLQTPAFTPPSVTGIITKVEGDHNIVANNVHGSSIIINQPPSHASNTRAPWVDQDKGK